MPLTIRAHPIGTKLHQLEIECDGRRLGEYERSQRADIERKTREVESALAELLEIERRHGQFVVRWNSVRREKVIYVDSAEVGTIAVKHWKTPSWK